MALGASGQLGVSNINTELGRSSNTANSSLANLVTLVNTCASPRPDGVVAHAISEWYSYNDSATEYTTYDAISQICGGSDCIDDGGTVQVAANIALTNGSRYSEGEASETVYRITSTSHTQCALPDFTFVDAQLRGILYCCA